MRSTLCSGSAVPGDESLPALDLRPLHHFITSITRSVVQRSLHYKASARPAAGRFAEQGQEGGS